MFHLSTKSRYGLRTLVELVLKGDNGPVSLNELSKGQKISKKYLENIYRMLQKNGIVRSIRGAKGGYKLAVLPDDLTVLKVMEAIEGPVRLIDCLEDEDLCSNIKNCPTRWLWLELEGTITAFLAGRTLRDLIDAFAGSSKGFEGMYI